MTGWQLDTNILSERHRPKPEPKVVAFIAAKPLDRLHVSPATIAEIRFGIELVADPGRRADLRDWLTHKVRPMYHPRWNEVPRDPLVCSKFNTYRFADYKDCMIPLFAKVVRISVDTVAITEKLKLAQRGE